MSKSGVPDEFYIAGQDKKFVHASAKIEGNTVVAMNKSIKKILSLFVLFYQLSNARFI